jgi:transposase-like protein
MLEETFGVEVSADTISAITDKVWPLVEAWQNRPLAGIYPIIYLDALHLKLRRQGRIENVTVYTVLGVDLEGHRDVLGHWIGDGAEGANFWLSVISDLQAR